MPMYSHQARSRITVQSSLLTVRCTRVCADRKRVYTTPRLLGDLQHTIAFPSAALWPEICGHGSDLQTRQCSGRAVAGGARSGHCRQCSPASAARPSNSMHSRNLQCVHKALQVTGAHTETCAERLSLRLNDGSYMHRNCAKAFTHGKDPGATGVVMMLTALAGMTSKPSTLRPSRT